MHITWGGVEHFALGLLSSFTAAFIAWVILVLRQKLALHAMEGHWLSIEGTPPQYSLGELRFSFWTKRHTYNGVHYKNDGERTLRWDTVKGYFDEDHLKFLYIYEVTHFDKSDKNHGFGQLIIPSGGHPVGRGETDGFYVDAETVNSAMHQVRLFRAKEIAKEQRIVLDPTNEEDRKNFIVQLALRKWSG
jgi:hypothetical protein